MRLRMAVAAALMIGAWILAACGDDDDDPIQTATPGVEASATADSATPGVTPEVPAISIDSPPAGASVSTPIEVSGVANTFEAALTVDVLDDAGESLCTRRIMATSGSGTPGTWSTTLAVPPPDAASGLTLRAYELSARDGAMINVVERAVTLTVERPALFITAPACGATIAPGTTMTVEGKGVVFEASFSLELRDAAGAVIAESLGMAGATEEAPFSVSMPVPADVPNGLYDLVAFSLSPEDGAVENEFSIQISIQS